ncbi:hypothetical protein H1R17_09565 [Flavobacterium sp. xlx-214]|uniref:hypothetical protein n=1 Tax=unclassified Flavobacterium TaxID=196869 RepID=UPI0013D6F504|nr:MULTISPECIES: hypothetical protein [unclassified Flavobacterium]MBA5793515.1 hypothetical protein [Flavobacterium sp. xlx-221]QMI82715.1 hypothetical protein H1R17_09565 [Flavobacterium sp. xlx-214]
MPLININQPDIISYLRVEPRTVTKDLKPTIKAAVHDAVWILTQQFRVGEFLAEDAGSPMKARIQTQSNKLNRFQSRYGEVELLNDEVPLEAKIERLPLKEDLGTRLEFGRIWIKLASKIYADDLNEILLLTLENFQIDAVGDDPARNSNLMGMRIRNLVTRRAVDGIRLYKYFKTGGFASDFLPSFPQMDDQMVHFLKWVENTYFLPETTKQNSWSEEVLEYQCSVSAPLNLNQESNQNVFSADRYKRGDLDWYSFDLESDPSFKLKEEGIEIDDSRALLEPETYSYIPTNIEFKGMPKNKWWEFEDRNTDFSKMLTQQGDISKMVVMEFGLIYSNDWFIIPHSIPDSSVTAINGLVVTDVFGRNFSINRAGTNKEQEWYRWDMYNISKKQSEVRETFGKLVSIPRIKNRMESEPIEKVMFLRDEMANMIWGVEEVVPDELFRGMDGKNTYLQLLAYLNDTLPQAVTSPEYIANSALHRFRLSNSVPENWIPFITTKQKIDDHQRRDVLVQRGAMLRYVDDNYTNEVIRPRTDILSIGVTENQPYFINEEIVGRSGFVITSNFQRARWYDGKVFTWLGRTVKGGRGEGNSGLKFDILADKESDL